MGAARTACFTCPSHPGPSTLTGLFFVSNKSPRTWPRACSCCRPSPLAVSRLLSAKKVAEVAELLQSALCKCTWRGNTTCKARVPLCVLLREQQQQHQAGAAGAPSCSAITSAPLPLHSQHGEQPNPPAAACRKRVRARSCNRRSSCCMAKASCRACSECNGSWGLFGCRVQEQCSLGWPWVVHVRILALKGQARPNLDSWKLMQHTLP